MPVPRRLPSASILAPVFEIEPHLVFQRALDEVSGAKLPGKSCEAWAYLASFRKASGIVWPSIERIARHIGVSVRSVSTYLGALIKRGLLVRERLGNRRIGTSRYSFPPIDRALDAWQARWRQNAKKTRSVERTCRQESFLDLNSSAGALRAAKPLIELVSEPPVHEDPRAPGECAPSWETGETRKEHAGEPLVLDGAPAKRKRHTRRRLAGDELQPSEAMLDALGTRAPGWSRDTLRAKAAEVLGHADGCTAARFADDEGALLRHVGKWVEVFYAADVRRGRVTIPTGARVELPAQKRAAFAALPLDEQLARDACGGLDARLPIRGGFAGRLFDPASTRPKNLEGVRGLALANGLILHDDDIDVGRAKRLADWGTR